MNEEKNVYEFKPRPSDIHSLIGSGEWMNSSPRYRWVKQRSQGSSKAKKKARKAQRQARRRNR